jgi:protein-S-isoprenylcysteine O-methyltransferase Ste14
MTTSVARTTTAPFRWRHRYSRWLLLLFFPLLAFLGPISSYPVWMDELAESLGISFLVVCLIGRGWTSIYVAGRKNDELVTVGPYSVVRNPLYVFSFIGLVGIGMLSEMVTLLIVAVVLFVLYYRRRVRHEEAILVGIHGDKFADYLRSVPRWIPKFSKWRDADKLEVDPRVLLRQFRDTSVFFLAFIFFELCEYLREIGLQPLIQLP